MGHNSSFLLMALIEDILDLSKIEAGTLVMNYSKFTVNELLNEVHELFYYQCSQKKVYLDISNEADILKSALYSDKGRLKQVLLNLVSNALKFTFKGGITIKVSKLRFLEKPCFEFTVEDTGIGIKDEDQGKLFQLFGMVRHEDGLNHNGCGIGLTISKKYVEKLGGEIKLESKYQVGTKITFTTLVSHSLE